MKFRVIATAAVASMCLAIPALAHHSFSMFDHEKNHYDEWRYQRIRMDQPP